MYNSVVTLIIVLNFFNRLNYISSLNVLLFIYLSLMLHEFTLVNHIIQVKIIFTALLARFFKKFLVHVSNYFFSKDFINV